MQCTSCRLHSNGLREYARVSGSSTRRESLQPIHLCPACRVLNALNPRYVPVQFDRAVETEPFAMSGAPESISRDVIAGGA